MPKPSEASNLQQTEPKRLSYPKMSLRPTKATPFQLPTQIISFSYTPEHVLEFTNSALRYFSEPPLGAQLGYGYERWIRRPEERGRIDSLLKAFDRAKGEGKSPVNLDDVGVVSWRGVMTRILTAPYEDRDGWDMNVMLVNGTMYLEEHLTEAKIAEKNNLEPRHRKMMYYGYAFESFSTSENPPGHDSAQLTVPRSHPTAPPGWGGDVDTNVQWCSVVRTKLGDIRLVIGGEVDCVRGKYTGSPDTFVELKTSLTIRNANDEAKFEKKLLKFYFQSFLLGVPEIVVGFRTPSGQLTTMQSFKTIEIPRMVRGKPGAWDPSVCLDWGFRFLTFLRDTVRASDADSIWRVSFVPKKGVHVMKLDSAEVAVVENGEERVGLLPRWYWDKIWTGTE
ncbi:RAI1-domain-containing protein [Dendrothele bispora CBS 962.96]|uniref:Decapping nuclease n=1 Tax=Dendrothele bispora (strain CBS 962.96) TaxID=1314807 RepID=A0A4S8L6S5_DENBC|nr:RAI1-domain-containing protein [Dendrothele bispora CBS 962.96]